MDIKRIPGAPAGVAGAFNYRGMPVPVVDLSEIAAGLPAPRRLSTRVILVNFRDGADNERLLGLLAERVTETFQRDPAEFVASGVTSDAAPYLGPVAAVGGRLLQLVEVRNLLPARISDALFRELEVGT